MGKGAGGGQALCVTTEDTGESWCVSRQPIIHSTHFINMHIYIACVNNTRVRCLCMMYVALRGRVGDGYQGYLMGFLNLATISMPAGQMFLILCFSVTNEFISSAPHRHSLGQVQVE